MSASDATSAPEFLAVTELSGEEITQQQLENLVRRYRWAGDYVHDKDVIEAACGAGPGLLYLKAHAKSLIAGDFSNAVLAVARRNLSDAVDLRRFDAAAMPFAPGSADVVMLFEAIYYLPSADRFLDECARVLRPCGLVLIVTANKDLYDFNPSPHSHVYYGVVELRELMERHGFAPRFFAAAPVGETGLKERILRPAKKLAVMLNLMPKTMHGKKWLKRAVFGKLVEMPVSITDVPLSPPPPIAISDDAPDRQHKVIYCAATLSGVAGSS